MSDEQIPLSPLPNRFLWNSSEWKKQICANCYFMIEVPKRKPTDPDMTECRESPPSLFSMPGLNALKQPVLQIAAQYPRLDKNYPACSKFKEKMETHN